MADTDHPLGASISTHRYAKGGLVTSVLWPIALIVVPCVVIAKWLGRATAVGPALLVMALFPAAFAVMGVFALVSAYRDWGLVLEVRERGVVVTRHGAAKSYPSSDVRV